VFQENNPIEIFLFSYLEKDKTLDAVKKIQRVNIHDPEFINSELTAQDFKDCCVIMDDMDCEANKKVRLKVMNLVQQMLQIGRHLGTTVLFLCHEVCNGTETKMTLNESHSITIFVKTLGNKKLKYLLDNYLGMDKEQMQKVKNIDSRAVTIFKSYSKVIFDEKDIFIL